MGISSKIEWIAISDKYPGKKECRIFGFFVYDLILLLASNVYIYDSRISDKYGRDASPRICRYAIYCFVRATNILNSEKKYITAYSIAFPVWPTD